MTCINYLPSEVDVKFLLDLEMVVDKRDYPFKGSVAGYRLTFGLGHVTCNTQL